MTLLLALACATNPSPTKDAPPRDTAEAEAALPLTDPSALDGRVFRVQLWDAVWIAPENANGLLNLLGEPAAHLLQAERGDDGALRFLVGVEANGGQDLCQPTLALPAASLADDPWFEAGPSDAALPWGGAALELEALRFTGRFTPEGQRWEDGTLSFIAHADSAAPALGLEPGALCDQLAGFGVDCQPCEDGRADCLPYHFEAVTGAQVSLAPLEEVARRGCHEGCDEDCLE